MRDVLPSDRVLDVGCNSGYIVQFLHPSCIAYGVDVAEDLVRMAKRHLRDARVAPAEALPFPDKSMDVVLLGEILEHVHDPVEVLREAARVARRLVAGSTPHEDGKWGPKGKKPPGPHRFHVRCFVREQLEAALREAGLVDIGISTLSRGGVQQFYVFRAATA